MAQHYGETRTESYDNGEGGIVAHRLVEVDNVQELFAAQDIVFDEPLEAYSWPLATKRDVRECIHLLAGRSFAAKIPD